MGAASFYEDILKRLEDAEFCDHAIAADLKALLNAPRRKGPSKKQVAIAHDVKLLLRALERFARKNKQLTEQLRTLEGALAAEKLHVTQLQRRSISNAIVHAKVENRSLNSQLAAKDKEIDDLRKLTMQRLFGKDG